MSYGGHDDHHHDHQHSHWGPHDWNHGHGGAPHNSWAPIMIAFGSSLFLLGFTKVFTQTWDDEADLWTYACLLYTSPSPRDQRGSRMPSSA